jgi:hypothetical protein
MNEKEKDAKNYLDAYDHVLGMFKVNNDNYFKRTQILMLVIQSALFLALTKLLWDSSVKGSCIVHISQIVIALLGVLSACVWMMMIKRQGDLLEFYKCYLRGIESRLMNDFDIPLGCFTYESKIAYRSCKSDKSQRFAYFKMDKNPDQMVILKSSLEEFSEQCCDDNEFRKIFPHKNQKVVFKLTLSEQYIARFLLFLWAGLVIVLFFILLMG